MDQEPIWLSPDLLLDIHAEQLSIFGGPPGLRDRGLLESALGRPRNKFAYGESDIVALAASYAYGVARNHPFIDGNKRAAFAAMGVFLGLNDFAFQAPPEQATAAILMLASGEWSEEQFAGWLIAHVAAASP